ncbi:cyclin-dependent kinase inhibitor 1C-like isoform X2 [Cyclopterus lumpus]|uniref:cyclin-dependent kinase inhibitor 1C-like isoform X2 n=1 Tax=Cyclopterus lumpus TaxID=8103 RepID=UPI0014861AC0|nr:cyclin-dependent kinase inhibitor 1C-like isoform X2 [Cyclopterus lumpus]
MSCRSTAPAVSFLLFLFLRVQSVHSTHARSVSSLSGFEPPEIDGYPVDICRIFVVPTPTPAPVPTPAPAPVPAPVPVPVPVPATTTPTTTTETTTPTTKKLVATTKKPAAQTPRRKPETKNTGTPIRPQPAPVRPITDSLLHYLLANGRGRLPGFNSFISQPMGGRPHKGYSLTSDSDESDSDESGAALVKRGGRTAENRWKISSFSSEDSSDES